MAQDSVERLLGRLITDEDFRKAAIERFDNACFEQGFELTDSERRLVRRIDFNVFSRMTDIIDSRIIRNKKGP